MDRSKLIRATVALSAIGTLAAAIWVTRYETLVVRGDRVSGTIVERNRYTDRLRLTIWFERDRASVVYPDTE